jgi:hypothetical protein
MSNIVTYRAPAPSASWLVERFSMHREDFYGDPHNYGYVEKPRVTAAGDRCYLLAMDAQILVAVEVRCKDDAHVIDNPKLSWMRSFMEGEGQPLQVVSVSDIRAWSPSPGWEYRFAYDPEIDRGRLFGIPFNRKVIARAFEDVHGGSVGLRLQGDRVLVYGDGWRAMIMALKEDRMKHHVEFVESV